MQFLGKVPVVGKYMIPMNFFNSRFLGTVRYCKYTYGTENTRTVLQIQGHVADPEDLSEMQMRAFD